MTNSEITDAAKKFTEYLIANGVRDIAVVVMTSKTNWFSMNIEPMMLIKGISNLAEHLLKEGVSHE